MYFFRRTGTLVVLSFFLALARPAVGQELDCQVSVNYESIDATEYAFLDDLPQRIEEYMNQQSWTEDRFQNYERIECSMTIYVLEALSLTEFRTRLVVATRRPIYGTTQTTTVTRFNDANWQFTYAQGQPLLSDLQRYDPLTSVLDFYAFVMLGYDYDTFSEEGGTPYFEEARRLVNLAQSSGAAGWTQVGGGTSREALVNQLLGPSATPLRAAYVDYHLNGLDRFTTATEEARATILEALRSLETFSEGVSRQYTLDIFFETKATELVAIFQDSPLSTEAYDLLTRLDPARDYEGLAE